MKSRLATSVLMVGCFVGVSGAEKARKPVPPQPAETYAMHDRHAAEHVTIAAEPGDVKETRPNTRLDYFGHGLLPVRVIVTNESDKPVVLDDARIHLIAGNNDNLAAATPEEIQRALFTLKGATGKKIPLPLPIPIPITTGKQNVDKKITDDDNDFGFQTTTVQPHQTVAGYLYYDVNGLDAPVLSHATLELRKVKFAGGDYLDSFEISLRPTGEAAAKDDEKKQ
jgi:hypothetical protein